MNNNKELLELKIETDYRLRFNIMRLRFFLVIYVLVNSITNEYFAITTLLLFMFSFIFFIMKIISILIDNALKR